MLGFSILFAFGASIGVTTEFPPGIILTASVLIIYYSLTTKFLRMQLRNFNNDAFKQEISSIHCQNWTFLACAILLIGSLIITVFKNKTARGDFSLMLVLMICTNTAKVLWDFHFIIVHRRVFGEALAMMENHSSFPLSSDQQPRGIEVIFSQQGTSERYGSVQSEVLMEEYRDSTPPSSNPLSHTMKTDAAAKGNSISPPQ